MTVSGTGFDLAIQYRLNVQRTEWKQEIQRCWDAVCVCVARSCVLCLWGHGGGCVPGPEWPVRPPLPCLFSVKSFRRRAAVTVWAQETGQGGTAGSVPVRREGAGREEETVRTLSQPGPGQPSYLWLLDLRGRLRTALDSQELCVSHLNQPRCSDNRRNPR